MRSRALGWGGGGVEGREQGWFVGRRDRAGLVGAAHAKCCRAPPATRTSAPSRRRRRGARAGAPSGSAPRCARPASRCGAGCSQTRGPGSGRSRNPRWCGSRPWGSEGSKAARGRGMRGRCKRQDPSWALAARGAVGRGRLHARRPIHPPARSTRLIFTSLSATTIARMAASRVSPLANRWPNWESEYSWMAPPALTEK